MDNNQKPNNGFNNVNPTNNLNNNGNINNENYNGMYNPLNQPTQPLNNVPNQGAGEQVINQTQSAYQQPVMSQPQDNFQQPVMSQPQDNYQEPIINQPQDNFQQPMDSPTNDFNGSDVKKPKIKLILIIVLAAAVIGVGTFLLLRKDSEKNDGIDITDSTSFFIEDKNKKYALFNEDGKQLTDFIFSYASEFMNGTAIVEKNDAYGIINENGKMTVDFGKYTAFGALAGMYEVIDEEENHFIIDGTGKKIQELDYNIRVAGYIGNSIYILEEDYDAKINKILNSRGQTIISFPMEESVMDAPKINSDAEDFISYYYDQKNHIINVKAKKELISFESDKEYCINKVVNNGKVMLLNDCDADEYENTYSKMIKDGKLFDLSSKCEKVYYKNNNFICELQDKEYLLDANLNIGIDTSDKLYVDNDTYVENAENYNGVNFYKNGKLIKNIKCRVLTEDGYAANELYVLTSDSSDSCNMKAFLKDYYKTNGERAFDKFFESAKPFDTNGLAVVSDDQKNDYLIDIKAKKVSQDYSGIYSYSGKNPDYYTVTKNDKRGIIDKKGNTILECQYDNIRIPDIDEREVAVLTTLDFKYITYDLKSKSVITTTEGYPILREHYFTVGKEGAKQYYTYKGKLFYEEK